MRLSTRLAAVMVALAIMTATAVGLVTYHNVESAILSTEINRQTAKVRLVALDFETRMRSARADIIGFASAVALRGIVRATVAGGTDPTDGTTTREWIDRFAKRLTAELRAKPDYLQFRVIGLADGGREILRVDRQGANDTIRTVSDDELQRKGDHDYFKSTIVLPRGAHLCFIA